jgi:hypothetical protein
MTHARLARRLLAAAALAGLPPAVPAQAPAALVAQGMRAYQDLEFDAAAGLLRRALTPPLADSLDVRERARALTYLGATERFLERRDSAMAVFRRLVLLDPRYRPDPLVFPPEVTRLFDEARLGTKVVAIRTAADTTIPLEQGWLTAWLFPSSPHDVTVGIAGEGGRPLRVLYAGPLGDSLRIRWDGRDSAGALVPGGRVWLTVASRGGRGGARIVQLPLTFDLALDTLAHPAPPSPGQLLPERVGRRTALRSLASGLVIGAAALSLPQVVAPGERSTGARVAVGGTLVVSGLVGYFTQRPGRPLPGNIAANRALRDAWRRRTDSIVVDNASRRRAASFRIRAGHVVVVEAGERAP